MKHILKIGVSREPPGDWIVNCRKIDLRERLLRRLLGEKRRLLIFMPGESVKTLTITEEGGTRDEQDEPAD